MLALPKKAPVGASVFPDANCKAGAGSAHEPTVRLHIWLEAGEDMFFGSGRALLLSKIDEHGSLRKAAEDLGMSYRAAWGKIKQTEHVLGVRLIEQKGCKKGGYCLTREGKFLRERYFLWFREVERWALKMAGEIFPWPVRSYNEVVGDAGTQAQNFKVQG